MLPPSWRKILHDLADSKLRTLLVVASIAVGVFAVGVIAGAYEIISNDMSASYAATNPVNLEVRASDFDDDMVAAIDHMRGVREAEGRRVFTLRVRPAGSAEWTALTFVAIDDFAGQRINQLDLLAGSPRPAKGELLLEKKARDRLGVPLGTRLELELPNGQVKVMPVAGFVQDQATGADDFLAAPMAFVRTDSLPGLRQPERFNRLFVTVARGQDDSEQLRVMLAAVKDKVEKSGLTLGRTHVTKSHVHPMAATVQAVLGILGALGVLVLFLSSSLIANTLNALLNQHLRYIGIMKLVGASRARVVGMYLALILAFSLIALAAAVPLGGQGAYALADFIAAKMNFGLQGYRLVPLAVAVQVLVGLAVPLLAGLAPVLTGSRISVQRALSGDLAREERHAGAAAGRPEMAAGPAAWLARRGLHLPRPLLISLRNTFRRRGRLLLTLFTLTMGGAIFVAVFNVRLTLHEYIGNIGQYFVADVTLDFDRPYRLDAVAQTAAQIPGVRQVEGWAFASAEALYPDGAVGENLTILAPPAASKLVVPMLAAGRWLEPGDERALAVSEGLLTTFPTLKPGDRLRLKVDGREADWLVVGLFKFVSQQGVIAYANYEYISRLTHLPNRSTSYRIVTDQHDPASQQAMSERIDRYFRGRGYHVREVRTGRSTLATASESLDILVTFLLIMALLTATVGSMGLAGTMGMNVLERTREIGIMRSIGAVDREIMRMVIVEGVVIGGLSWLLGALASFPITYLLATIISLAIFQSPISVVFTLDGYALWLAVVLVLSAVASVLPARNAARLTIREVLAYE